MKTAYKATFIGRENGAIGITHPNAIIVMAESMQEAEKMLYKTHEHISSLSIIDLTNHG